MTWYDTWFIRSTLCAVTKYLTNLGDRRWSMPKKAANPFPGDYEPELDTTPTLNPELSSWYASLIGMLRWMLRSVEWISSRRY